MDGQPDILRGCARLGQRSSPPGSSHGWFRGPVTGKEAGESGLQPGKAVGSPDTGCSGADRAPPAPEPRFRARGFTAEARLGAPAQGPVLALTAPAGPCGRWEAALLESGSSVPGTLPWGQAPRESRPRPQGPPGSPGGLPPRLGTACLSPGETNEKGGRPELGGSQPQGSLTCSGRSPWDVGSIRQELGQRSLCLCGGPAWGPLRICASGGWSELALWTRWGSRPGESLPAAGEAHIPR